MVSRRDLQKIQLSANGFCNVRGRTLTLQPIVNQCPCVLVKYFYFFCFTSFQIFTRGARTVARFNLQFIDRKSALYERGVNGPIGNLIFPRNDRG